MLYELHVTVERPEGVVGIDRAWAEACDTTGSKPLLIELQPQGGVQMMNAQVTECDPAALESWVAKRVSVLPIEFDVVRIKAEVPLDKGFAAYPEPCYHECHVKMLCDPERAEQYWRIAASFGWVVSRNLYLPGVAGKEKWYLTQRRYDTPALQAAREFHDAWAKIQPNMPPAARMEMETVISDSNPDLDAGWV